MRKQKPHLREERTRPWRLIFLGPASLGLSRWWLITLSLKDRIPHLSSSVRFDIIAWQQPYSARFSIVWLFSESDVLFCSTRWICSLTNSPRWIGSLNQIPWFTLSVQLSFFLNLLNHKILLNDKIDYLVSFELFSFFCFLNLLKSVLKIYLINNRF